MVGACPVDAALLSCLYRCYPEAFLLGAVAVGGCLLIVSRRWGKIALAAVAALVLFRIVR